MPRNRGIKLPDAGDVQQVGFANDPGVNVPNLGIDIGGFNVDAAVDAVQRAAAKQQKLLDATKTAEAYEAFGRTTMDDFNRRRLEEDSSNPEFLKSFQGFLDQGVESAISNLPEGVSEEAKANLRMRLSSQRNAFMDSAGQVHLGALQDRAAAAIESQTNIYSAQAYRDPSLLDGILDLADESLNEFAGALPQGAEEKYRQEARGSIIESAIAGLVDLGGTNEALALMKSDRFNADLDPRRRAILSDQIVRRAEMLARAAEIDAARGQRLMEAEERRVSKQAQDKYFAKLGQGATDPLAKEIMLDDTLTPEDKRSMLSVVERSSQAAPLSEVSHATSTSLFARIHLPDGHPDKIIDENAINQEFIAGRLNDSDRDSLRKEVADARTPEGDMLGKRMNDFFNAIEPQVNPKGIFGLPSDPTGGEQMYRFQDMVRRKVQEYRSAKRDPFTLFDPASPDYLGKPETVKSYSKSLPEQMQSIIEGMSPGATAMPSAEAEYNSPEDVAAAYQANLLTREQATQILRDKGWAQ